MYAHMERKNANLEALPVASLIQCFDYTVHRVIWKWISKEKHLNEWGHFDIFLPYFVHLVWGMGYTQKQNSVLFFTLLLKGTIGLNSTASKLDSQIKLAFKSKGFQHCGAKWLYTNGKFNDLKKINQNHDKYLYFIEKMKL